jgi:hypothetical protein
MRLVDHLSHFRRTHRYIGSMQYVFSAAVFAFVMIMNSLSVWALSPEQRSLIDSGVLYYNIQEACKETGNPDAEPVSFTGTVLAEAEQVKAFTGPQIEPTAIILHWTTAEYDNPQQLVEILKGRVEPPDYPNGRAVQLTVDKAGKVYQLSETLETKPTQSVEDKGWNDASIGIEIESGSFENDMEAYENDLLDNSTQYAAVLNVVKELMAKYNIPNEVNTAEKRGVFGHLEVNESSSDPGPRYMEKVRKDLGATGEVPSEEDPAASSLQLSTSCQCSTSAEGASGPLVGGDNTEKAWNFFISKGLEPHMAGGIIGNLLGESGLIPNRKQGNGIQTISSPDEIVNGKGFGIAQWTYSDTQNKWKQFAIEKNMDPLSLELQLEFLLNQLETNPGLGYEHLKQAPDLPQATWIFLAFFERPAKVINAGKAADPVQPTSGGAKTALDDRVALATPVIETYADNPAAALSGSGGSCSGGGALTGDVAEPDYAANPAVKVDGSPPGGHRASNCTGTFTPGAASLKEVISERWSPPVTSIGGYACRGIVGGSSTSVHGLGRALDVMIDSTTPEGLAKGDEIRNWTINNAATLGVQRVIWNRMTWVANKDGWRPYTGKNPHTDHLHIEINLEKSTNASLGR